MKRLLVAILLLAALVSFGEPAKSKASSQVGPAVVERVVVAKEIFPVVTAKAYTVFDLTTGEVLLAKDADEALPIASVTKLFTAESVLELAQDEKVVVSAADVATEGRAGKLAVGEEYSVHELLFPLLLESSNDAAAALERVVGTPEVAGHVFADTSGLSDKNLASARELAFAVRELYFTKPHIFDITKLSQKVSENNGWVNNSPVRDLPGYLGGKHGYTTAAGRTLAAIFSESALGGREIGYIVLGSNNVRSDVEQLRAGVAESVRLQ